MIDGINAIAMPAPYEFAGNQAFGRETASHEIAARAIHESEVYMKAIAQVAIKPRNVVGNREKGGGRISGGSNTESVDATRLQVLIARSKFRAASYPSIDRLAIIADAACRCAEERSVDLDYESDD